MEVKIQKGMRSQLKEVLELVKELADYVDSPQEVVTTLEDYYQQFDAKLFDFLVAKDENDNVLGMMLYYFIFSTWKGKMMFLEDFVIKEEFRHQGIGQKMFQTLLQVAKDENCKLVKWQVIESNSNAIKFYQKQNAILEKIGGTVKSI